MSDEEVRKVNNKIVTKKSFCTKKAGIYYKFGKSCYSSKDLSKIAKALDLRIVSKPKGFKWQKISEQLGIEEPEWEWTEKIREKMKVPDTPERPTFTNYYTVTSKDAYYSKRFTPTSVAREYERKAAKVQAKKDLRREIIGEMQQRTFLPQLGIGQKDLIGSDQINAFLHILTKYSTIRNMAAFFTHNLPSKEFCRDEERLRNYYMGENSQLMRQTGGRWTRWVIITNTEYAGAKSKKSGKHWVVIYVDRTKKTPGLEYFDSMSTGEPKKSEKELYCLWNRFKEWNEKGYLTVDKKPLPVRSNQVVVQRGKIECGIFAMWFVAQRIQGKPMEKVVTRENISDAKCAQLRKIYFRPSNAQEEEQQQPKESRRKGLRQNKK